MALVVQLHRFYHRCEIGAGRFDFEAHFEPGNCILVDGLLEYPISIRVNVDPTQLGVFR
jgi:hypothetical protein